MFGASRVVEPQGSPIELSYLQQDLPIAGRVIRCSDGYQLTVDSAASTLPTATIQAIFHQYAPRWATQVIDAQGRRSARLGGQHVLPVSEVLALREAVQQGIATAGGRLFSIVPVEVIWGPHRKLFGVCRLRTVAATGQSLASLHRHVTNRFGLELIFDRLPQRARVRVDVAEFRRDGLVLAPGSTLPTGQAYPPGNFPIVSNVGLPTIAIDSVGTTRPEDLLTAAVCDDGAIEVWRFVPDDQHVDRFFPRIACPAFGVGYRVTATGDRPLTPIRALVKMHRQFEESDGSIFSSPQGIAPRFVRVFEALQDVLRIRGNGHLPALVGLGGEMVAETFHGSARALFEGLDGADVRLVVRKDFAHGEIRRVLQSIAPELEEWELRVPEHFAFQLARLTDERGPDAARVLIDLVASDGAFAVRRPRAEAGYYRARLKANSADGRINQAALRAHLYGTPQEPISTLKAICTRENERLQLRIDQLQRALRTESLYKFVAFTRSHSSPTGEVLGFLEQSPGISMKVHGYSEPVSMPSWDLGAAVRAASRSMGVIPLRWAGYDTATGRAFVRVRQGG